MGQMLRWLTRIAFVMVVLATITLALMYYFAARSLPDYNATVQVSGLFSPVEIVRDNANVPHIFPTKPENAPIVSGPDKAGSAADQDVFFGLGYVHAQDRLWQMTMLRRTVQGRLSEVFGVASLPVDKLMRRLDLYPLARQSVLAQDARTTAALLSYSAGVNARLEEINRDALGRGAPEMFIFNAPIAPWQPADSIAIVKLMALQLSSQLENEVLRARTSLLLPDAARLSDILPDAPGIGIATLPDYASIFKDLPKFADSTPLPDHPLSPFRKRAFASASNAWAAASTRSASGGTLLANDPHLTLTAPAIWYLARLELSSGGVIGGTIPGIPSILTGRRDDMGWGLTAASLDDQDVYIEQLNPENPQEYRTPDGFKPFLARKSIITIKDAAPVTLSLLWTDNGPVLPASHYNLGTITPKGHVAALAWTALNGADTTMSGAMGLMFAKNVQEAIAISEKVIAPAQNITLADQNGIAMITSGAMPRRDAAHESRGRLPSRGWIAANRWRGRIPYAANPVFIAPQGGILGNTNNKVVDRPFPLHVSYNWGDTQRINRWKRLMQSRQVHTRDSFIETQLDTVSITARTLLPLIGADLWFTGTAAPQGTPERLRQRALTLLADWNGEMNEHLPEPLLYSAWLRALQVRLIRDELGPLSDEYTHLEPLFIERVFRDVDGAAVWCDVLQSSPKETCSDMARLALDDALIWITEKYGRALESLRWGDAHQATQDHQTLGGIPVLRYFVNIRQSTSGGDNTLRRGTTRASGSEPFQNVHGAAYRGVYDFADPDSSVFVISTGQSGHFLSRYYDDLGERWRSGEYIPMSLDEGLARAAAVGVTRLMPSP
ncbi:MAG: penicillin acylase family protein [Rhodobacterales bacterium]|nr:penicillin acylase family protein [Rhodobacterales bacterium]